MTIATFYMNYKETFVFAKQINKMTSITCTIRKNDNLHWQMVRLLFMHQIYFSEVTRICDVRLCVDFEATSDRKQDGDDDDEEEESE